MPPGVVMMLVPKVKESFAFVLHAKEALDRVKSAVRIVSLKGLRKVLSSFCMPKGI